MYAVSQGFGLSLRYW